MFNFLQGSWCQRLPQLVGRLHANRYSHGVSHDRGVVIRSHQAFQSLRMKPFSWLRREHPQVWILSAVRCGSAQCVRQPGCEPKNAASAPVKGVVAAVVANRCRRLDSGVRLKFAAEWPSELWNQKEADWIEGAARARDREIRSGARRNHRRISRSSH